MYYKRITTLDELTDEFRQIYSGWCFRGKKDSSLTCRVTRYQSYEKFECGWEICHREYCLDKICNWNDRNEYDYHCLWLRYDSSVNKVSIYRRVMRDTKLKTLSMMKTKYCPSNIRISDFNKFCLDCGLHGEVLPIKITYERADPPILPFTRTSEAWFCGDIFAISGTITDFAKAGWQKEYDRAIAEKENELARRRRRIAQVLPLAEKLYYSKLMEEIQQNDSYSGLLSKTRLTSFGIDRYDSVLETYRSPFMFSSRGYRNIASEEELIAFAVAFLCAENQVPPSELNLDEINWRGDEMIRRNNGTMYIEASAISYPFFQHIQKKLPVAPAPILKDLY